MKLLIIPTLNERKNITILFKKIRKIDQEIDILFVDDNSFLLFGAGDVQSSVDTCPPLQVWLGKISSNGASHQ